jgi:16S rRNA (uracil1498-N3)-methyltransferase
MSDFNSIPNTHRFFVLPDVLSHTTITLDDETLVHQIHHVLRLRKGDYIILLDGRGRACTVVIDNIGQKHVIGTIVAERHDKGEPTTTVVLYPAMIRAERFEWILQKGTELGVHMFVPVNFSRSQPADCVNERKLVRWRKIVREAAEQSCREIVPDVREPIAFGQACREAISAHVALLLWEGDSDLLRTVLRQQMQRHDTLAPATLSILSGPVGGITLAELTQAKEHGIIPVSLGPRILRAETAPVVAAAAIFYELEG